MITFLEFHQRLRMLLASWVSGWPIYPLGGLRVASGITTYRGIVFYDLHWSQYHCPAQVHVIVLVGCIAIDTLELVVGIQELVQFWIYFPYHFFHPHAVCDGHWLCALLAVIVFVILLLLRLSLLASDTLSSQVMFLTSRCCPYNILLAAGMIQNHHVSFAWIPFQGINPGVKICHFYTKQFFTSCYLI